MPAIGHDDPGGETPRVGAGAEIIHLREAQIIGRGRKRHCFLHPHDPRLCVKVSNGRVPRAGAWHRRLLHPRSVGATGDDYNRREWRAYRHYGTILAPHVPRCYGLARTSCGLGLVLKLVRNGDGTPSPELAMWLARSSPQAAESLRGHFRDLFDVLYREEIWLFDLNLRNFLVQDAGDGAARPWLIDLKRLAASKETFQAAGWSTRRRHCKLSRRIDHFHAEFGSRSRS